VRGGRAPVRPKPLTSAAPPRARCTRWRAQRCRTTSWIRTAIRLSTGQAGDAQRENQPQWTMALGKTEVASAVANSMTTVPVSKLAVQMPPQSIPTGKEVMAPHSGTRPVVGIWRGPRSLFRPGVGTECKSDQSIRRFQRMDQKQHQVVARGQRLLVRGRARRSARGAIQVPHSKSWSRVRQSGRRVRTHRSLFVRCA
jgi:hypothetical protein